MRERATLVPTITWDWHGSSLDELCTQAATTLPENTQLMRRYHDTCPAGSWRGGSNARINTFLVDGPAPHLVDLVDTFAKTLNATTPAGTRKKRVRTRGDYGDELDIHAVRAGRNDIAWTRRQRRNVTGTPRFVHIYLRVGGASRYSGHELAFMPALAAAVGLRIAQVSRSIRVAYTLLSISHKDRPNSGRAVRVTTRIANYGERISTRALALTADAYLFRGIVMRLRVGTLGIPATSIYTHTGEYTPELLVPIRRDETPVVIPAVYSMSDARAAATDIFANLAIQ